MPIFSAENCIPGGNAANVAVLAKRAGAEKSGYIGVLATDAAGEHFRTVLQTENVDISRLRRGVGRTACNYITLDDQGDRAFSGNNGQETVQKPVPSNYYQCRSNVCGCI